MEQHEIKALREQKKLTQEELARLLGVSVRTVTRWELGSSRPSRLAMFRLSQVGIEALKGVPLAK